jgi:hypothetical protein
MPHTADVGGVQQSAVDATEPVIARDSYAVQLDLSMMRRTNSSGEHYYRANSRFKCYFSSN